jgi:hypothetical protein
MTTSTETLIQKLETFAGTLTDGEREVLGELLANSMDQSKSVDEVSGYALAFGSSSLLGGSIASAQANGNLLTRLYLQTAPNALTLAAAGPRARLGQ